MADSKFMAGMKSSTPIYMDTPYLLDSKMVASSKEDIITKIPLSKRSEKMFFYIIGDGFYAFMGGVSDDKLVKIINDPALTPEQLEELNNALNNKVEKEEEKGLSSNDFTDEYKEKLDNIDLDKYVEKEEGKSLSTNDFTDEYKEKLDNIGDIDNPNSFVMITGEEMGKLANGENIKINEEDHSYDDKIIYVVSN